MGSRASVCVVLTCVICQICEGKPPELPARYSPELRGLVGTLLDKVPQRRPSAADILRIPFIAERMVRFAVKVEQRSSIALQLDQARIAQAYQRKCTSNRSLCVWHRQLLLRGRPTT